MASGHWGGVHELSDNLIKFLMQISGLQRTAKQLAVARNFLAETSENGEEVRS